MTFYLYRNFLMGKRGRWGTRKAGFVIPFIALCWAMAFLLHSIPSHAYTECMTLSKSVSLSMLQFFHL